MSTYIKQAGFKTKGYDSYDSKEFQAILKSLPFIKEFNLSIYIQDKDALYEKIFWENNIDTLKKWIPYLDTNGTWGFVYLLEEEEFFDLSLTIKENDFKTIQGELCSQQNNEIEFFVIVYYNGGDSPFKFKKN